MSKPSTSQKAKTSTKKSSLNKGNAIPNSVAKFVGVLILVVCMFVIGFVSGRLFEDSPRVDIKKRVSFSGDLSGDDVDVDFNLFWQVWNELEGGYVDDSKIDEEKMFYGAIKGFVNSYDDPATIFLTPGETKDYNDSSQGKYFEGIGAELGYEDGSVIVISPLEGSPAVKAGIRPGDLIMKVDGEDLKPSESIFDIVKKIRGEAGTDVVLTVLHKGDTKVQDITITRSAITVPSMDFEKVGGSNDIVMIDLARFTDSSLGAWEKNWDDTVDEVLKSGADKLILDLRGNPGGYFNAAIYAANEFLTKGTLIAMQEDQYGATQKYKATRKGRLSDIELIVLVDGGSASASEILAGALQKNSRGTIVGENTYGKGTAQSVVPFADGSSLHITVMKWLLPDGKWLNRENVIEPDKLVEITDEDFTEGNDPQLDKAVKMLSK